MLIISRRGKEGDRDRAYEITTKALENKENESSDLYGLCGRISKDYFVESGYENQEMLQEVNHQFFKSNFSGYTYFGHR